MDAAAKRELHDAIWRSSGGFDLVLAPVLIALLGLWIDSAAGTRPVFMLAFLAFGTVGAVLKVYYDYQRGMHEAAEHAAVVREEAARLRAEAAELGARPVRDFTGEIDTMPLEGSDS